MNGLTLDWETADRITLASLKDQLELQEKEVKEHLENGKWMHAEDLHLATTQYIPALKTVIKFYGG